MCVSAWKCMDMQTDTQSNRRSYVLRLHVDYERSVFMCMSVHIERQGCGTRNVEGVNLIQNLHDQLHMVPVHTRNQLLLRLTRQKRSRAVTCNSLVACHGPLTGLSQKVEDGWNVDVLYVCMLSHRILLV